MSAIGIIGRNNPSGRISLIVSPGGAPTPRPPPPPPGAFFLGVNLSGLEDNSGTPSQTEMAYFVSKGITTFRIPLYWPSLQPFAYGPLNLTYYAQVSQVLANAAAAGGKVILDFHNFGRGPNINALLQTNSIGASPWATSRNISALPVVTLNAALDPAGNLTASQIVYPAVSAAGAWSQISQNFSVSTSFNCSFYVDLQGAVGGEVVYIMFVGPDFAWHSTRCVLTTSWQRFVVTASASAGTNFFQIGTDLRDSAQSATSAQTIFAAFAQVQVATAPTAYSSNPPNYSVVNPNYGQNPVVGTVNLPSDALAAAWVLFSALLKADAHFSSVGGYDPMNEWQAMDPNSTLPSTPFGQSLILSAQTQVLNALRGVGDNTTLYLEWDHFSGAWDSVTNNIEMLMDLVLSDPAQNSNASVHCYLDQNSSGTFYVWSQVIAAPGEAPPGLNVTVNIGPQRMAAVIALAQQKRCPITLGETGFSNDNLSLGGANDFFDWNTAGFNMLSFCQSNHVPVIYWAGGPGFAANYGLTPDPVSTSNQYGAKDFTSAGLQASQMVVLEQFTNFAGAQPQAYIASLPFGVTPYTPSGTPLPNFTVQYNGVISGEITFTGHAALADGTPVGGAFSTVQLPPGQNGVTSFSYTPAGTFIAIFLTFTNNAGLLDPPAIGVSSEQSFFNTVGATASNIYSTRLWNFPYIGSSFTVSRPQDNMQMTFGYDVNGNLPRQAMQDWGNTRVFGVAAWFDQSGNGFNMSFNPTTINLNLVDTDGYPSVNIPSAVTNPAGGPVEFLTPSIGAGQQSIYAEINPTNNNLIISQDQPLDNFRLSPANYDVGPNNGSRTFVGVGATLSTWSTITGTYSNLYGVNNLKGYVNGSLAHQVSAPQFVNASANNECTFGTFKNSPLPIQGSLRTAIIQYLEYSGANVGLANTSYVDYTATPLPDSLSSVAPTIVAGGLAVTVFVGVASPFSNVTIFDYNSGSPTETATITLVGAAGGVTLSGSGISGSNPYTTTTGTPAAVTTILQGAQLNGVASGQTLSITISVTNSLAKTASTSMPVTVSAYGIETAFTPPAGTFTPIGNFKGYMLGGPDVTGTGSSFFPFNAQIDYMASQGFGMLKLPTTQSNAIQGPTPFQPWVVSYVNNMKTTIDYAFTKGMYVMIAFYDSASSLIATNTYAAVGVNPVATNSFADQRSRIASRFKNYPNVLFEMENEPKFQTVNQWFKAQNIGISAMRLAGFTGTIGVSGNGFQHTDNWTSSGNAAQYASFAGDPLNNFVFCFHAYLDSDNSGQPPNGFKAASGKGSTILGDATTWMAGQGYQGILTEFGIGLDPFQPDPANVMQWLNSAGSQVTGFAVEGPALMAYMKTTAPSQWIGWTEFAGGVEFSTLPTAPGPGFANGGYDFNPEPSRAGFSYNSPLTPNTQTINILIAGL